ncbi:CHAD domain-containing protein [Natronoglycomyces albus]|uniref:CHAD domain-containing protein n=1 Tax=Natronoglycomyces albus TaxID=2811108 RepID=A0A895XHY2_9ACTN|nr:CHAD domain-containing protein [Natronoglycomyces albus]QSB04944.1 CHAD domain-containing protein [Natronoglycomyces albus]
MSAPSIAAPTEASHSQKAGDLVLQYMSHNIDMLNGALARAQRAEAGSVGQTRESTRRILTATEGFGHLFTGMPEADPQMHQLIDSLRRAHHLESLQEYFADRFDQLGLLEPEYPSWYARLGEQTKLAYLEVERLATQTWVARMIARIRYYTEHPHLTKEGNQPAATLAAVLTAARMRLMDSYRRLNAAADVDLARDQTRQIARRARYLAEATQPTLAWAARDIIIPAGQMQHLLGQYRNAIAARNWLLRLPGADRAKSLTISLAQLEREHQRQLAAEIDAVAKEIFERW